MDEATRPHRRVAVIGSGPSGLYAAAALVDAGVSVDVLERLPAPFGLVRYGVAPDHVKMKSVIRVLQKAICDDNGARFLGNVTVGRGGVPLERLRLHYDAIIHATGSSVDRALGIPGEDLYGSLGSGAFVSWYCGHPDFTRLSPPLDHSGVAVVGAGNVALDVARVLARPAEEMATTDVPDAVLEALRASQVRDIHVLIRRGPQHVKFTPPELRQLGALTDVGVVVHDDGALATATDSNGDKRQQQNLRTLQQWAARPRSEQNDRARRVHLWFLRRPVRIVGNAQGRVTGIVVERNRVDETGRVHGTGEEQVLDVGLVIRAIGYQAEPVAGLPYDADTGTVPNVAGRVVDDGTPVVGQYVTGWLKRGPSGVIGTNKSDAAETVAALLEDLPELPPAPQPDSDAVLVTLAEHGIRPVSWQDWLQLDAEEIRLGGLRGTERVKVAELNAMIQACLGAASSES